MSKTFGVNHSRPPLNVYVHCGTSVEYLADLNASIPGVQHYAERALLLAERDDVVCVPDEIDSEYLDYLAEIGIGPAAGNLLVASRFDDSAAVEPLWRRLLSSREAIDALGCMIERSGAGHIHPFIATRGQFELGEALQRRSGVPVRVNGGDPAVVAYADFKHHVRAKAIELGIPVAAGGSSISERQTAARPRRYFETRWSDRSGSRAGSSYAGHQAPLDPRLSLWKAASRLPAWPIVSHRAPRIGSTWSKGWWTCWCRPMSRCTLIETSGRSDVLA
jgi:hypothetical protein